jgi:hypothetical protein
MGFGMDENGAMHSFHYTDIIHLSVSGNEVTIDTYNKGMEAKFKGGEKKEEPKEDEETEEDELKDAAKEESIMNLKDIIKEISEEEVEAEMEAAQAEIDAAKAKFKASQAAMKDTIKKSKDKMKAAKANLKVATEGVVKEDHEGYEFGTGDIVKNKNTSCPHHGSMGIVDKVMDLPDYVGKVAVYTVTNNGDNFKAGDKLTKTVDQLEPVEDEM